jgi:hypothetical protein
MTDFVVLVGLKECMVDGFFVKEEDLQIFLGKQEDLNIEM